MIDIYMWIFSHMENEWQLTPVCMSGESHGQRRLVGYNPQGCKEFGHDRSDLAQTDIYS